MHETPDDLARLQRILDVSHTRAGRHLQDVIAPERRLDAATLAAQLDGMRLLVLATSNADGRPIAGPVDGVFYRGRFHFGSAPDSVRFRHLARRPHVSATHLPGEHFAVTVHGRAERIDLTAREHAGLRDTVLGIYVPRYGPEWEAMLTEAAFARIHPDRMFTFWMPEAS